jgi:hypothetical protein
MVKKSAILPVCVPSEGRPDRQDGGFFHHPAAGNSKSFQERASRTVLYNRA